MTHSHTRKIPHSRVRAIVRHPLARILFILIVILAYVLVMNWIEIRHELKLAGYAVAPVISPLAEVLRDIVCDRLFPD